MTISDLKYQVCDKVDICCKFCLTGDEVLGLWASCILEDFRLSNIRNVWK